MPILKRENQKIFGETGPKDQFGQIGSAAAGAPTTTKDIEVMQELNEYRNGYFDIVTRDETQLPYSEDLNSLHYMATRQLAYLMQKGIPEWNKDTEYFSDQSFVQYNGELYLALRGTESTPNKNKIPANTVGDHWTKPFDHSDILGQISALSNNSLQNWHNETHYGLDALVVLSGRVYVSRRDGNRGNAPPNEGQTTYWKTLLPVESFPIGYTYIQFPGQDTPDNMDMPGDWTVVSDYRINGRFMRFQGGEAASFGSTQSDKAPRLHGVKVERNDHSDTSDTFVFLPTDSDGFSRGLGAFNALPHDAYSRGSYQLFFESEDTGEVRPTNVTVKLWRRRA